MIKKATLLLSYLLLLSNLVISQTFDGDWSVEYVTSDSPDSSNSIGYNVISVAAVEEDAFVALVNRGSANAHYLVGFRNAGKNTGRLGNVPYQLVDNKTKWISGFDQEYLFDANDIASKGNLIYVPNNDSISNSILVFELKTDSIYTYPQRYKVNAYIWAIDVDDNGRIYVTKTGDSTKAGSVLILENPDATPKWVTNGKQGKILQEFSLPDIGSPRGITANSDGTVLYVGNWDENKIYCYVGDPISGYTLLDDFKFEVAGEVITADTTSGPLKVGPFGIQYMREKNLLFVAHDASFVSGDNRGYSYGRIYIANPNTGEVLDTIDAAKWNFQIEGRYNNHNPGNLASGYTSNYAVDFDENLNVYTQSWYGWTVDKWVYSGTLPTIELTITDIKVNEQLIPEQIELKQNYPNPFNPTTTVEFSLNKQSDISLKIYNITGELVTNLIKNKNLNKGSYKITFDASNLVSGTYIYQLQVGEKTLSNKMILIK
ncbi:MAG: T9SS type A sorting domain-containing protein [Ignavibacteriae bacterium]|nr:T9SS type A sorting domain-containing protein [Ignavibacteriota bacterium]